MNKHDQIAIQENQSEQKVSFHDIKTSITSLSLKIQLARRLLDKISDVSSCKRVSAILEGTERDIDQLISDLRKLYKS